MRARVLLLMLTYLGVLTSGVFAQRGGTSSEPAIDFGEPAPRWLRESESYAIGYDPNGWDALAQAKVQFITHCPVNREFFTRCHAFGIRCFPYVTFYQGYASQTYQDVNLKDHPDFIEVDQQGNLKRSGFWESEDAKNMYTTCPNVAGYQDAMVAWTKKILELGADGVFIDNISTRVSCFGPKFGKHQHVCEDQNQAFAILLKRVREAVKQRQPDGAVIVNSASPLSIPAVYWKHIDADMLESYICTWVSTDRWFDWKNHWHQQGVKLQPYLKAGKQVQALSYLGHTSYGIKEDAYFCYATARLAGFVWNGGVPLSHPAVAALYRLRLGSPLADEIEEQGVYWRPFEAGLVAVNPDKTKPATITLRSPVPANRFYDFFDDGAEHWNRYGQGAYLADTLEKHGGRRAIRCVNAAASAESGTSQTVELNQDKPVPIRVGGWSRCQNVVGASDGNYALYLDIAYRDGTYLYGQVAPFACGTHDWQFSSVTVKPEKPIKSLTYNVLFRYKAGTVWFDDVSLQVLDDPQTPRDVLQNGGFEDASSGGRLVDATATGKLIVPPYSGRVFLYAASAADELTRPGPRLTVVTRPALGEVRFRVDGFDYWTHGGRWTTEYTLGPDFGKFHITLDRPGQHVVEVVDVVPADMKTPAGYGSGERLGQFMDPSNPTRPSAGKKFRFRGWAGERATGEPKRTIEVTGDTNLIAEFEVQETK
jgi:hypothetical protein